MIITVEHKGELKKVDLSKPIDISMPYGDPNRKANAWYCNDTVIEPVVMGDFVGEVAQGGSVNFRNISFNPHGNGTHTECVGHISKEKYSINRSMQQYHCFAAVGTVEPIDRNGDKVIDTEQLKKAFPEKVEAIIIRTLPNNNKLIKDYTETNPPYITKEGIDYINELGVVHLLIDMPSVDREQDGGALICHHTFWNYPTATIMEKTITELIYVDDSIADGVYFLNIMIAPFENDATPSKPIIYRLF